MQQKDKMDEITEEQLVNVKYGFEELFKRADKNQDGKVSTEECAQILESIFGKIPRKRLNKIKSHLYFFKS